MMKILKMMKVSKPTYALKRGKQKAQKDLKIVKFQFQQGNDKDRGSVQLMKKSLVSSLRKLNLSHLHSNTH